VQIGKFRSSTWWRRPDGANARPATRSIGQVLKVLKEDFEDISISKIRFLEGEGLVSPSARPSGYRRYSDQDIERLRYILEVQQKHYLPLKVIREHLEKLDAGEQPVSGTTAPSRRADPWSPLSPRPWPPERQPQAKRPINIPRRELLRMSGLTESQLARTGAARAGGAAPRHRATTAATPSPSPSPPASCAAYGMDARHLRAIKQAAEREAALIDQAVLTARPDRHRSRQTSPT
jgi:DNA-binding transcriptional MerR regulator